MLVGKSVPATRGFKTKLQYAINNAATVSGKDEYFFFAKREMHIERRAKEMLRNPRCSSLFEYFQALCKLQATVYMY